MATKVVPKFYPIANEAELVDLVTNVSASRIVLLDCHEEWCGPTTTAMMATYTQIYGELEAPDKRIHLATLQYTDALKAKLQSYSQDVKIAQQGCRPLFLAFRNGSCVGAVDGLNTPAVASLIKLWIPPVATNEDDQ